jgi:hypothetical protein
MPGLWCRVEPALRQLRGKNTTAFSLAAGIPNSSNRWSRISFGVMSPTTFSGSLILKDVKSGAPNPVGLLFAVSPSGALANAANAVAAGLGVTFVGAAATTADSASAAERVDPRVEAASQAIDRNGAFLMSLPEVLGYGVGYSLNGSGNVVIRLFVRKLTDVARQAAPTSLEGIPVEVQETGEFRVIPCKGRR